MYTLPPHRFTVYAMGILLGYVLRKFKDIKLTNAHLKIGWYVSTASLLLAFFGPGENNDHNFLTKTLHHLHFQRPWEISSTNLMQLTLRIMLHLRQSLGVYFLAGSYLQHNLVIIVS
jgi:hypothetical protein